MKAFHDSRREGSFKEVTFQGKVMQDEAREWQLNQLYPWKLQLLLQGPEEWVGGEGGNKYNILFQEVW